MSDKTLEFRVIQGMQAGASMTLNLRTYVVGSSKDCDIVLSGSMVAPEHAKISVTQDGFFIEPIDKGLVLMIGEGEVHGRTSVHFGKLIRLGSACITIDFILASWPSTEEIASQEKGIVPIKVFEEETEITLSESVPFYLEIVDTISKNKVMVGVLSLLFLLGGSGFLTYHFVTEIFFPSSAVEIALVKTPLTESEIRKAIEQAFLQAHIKTKIEVQKDGDRYFLTAYVPDSKSYQALLNNLNAVDAPIGAQIFVESLIKEKIRHAVEKISKNLKIEYMGQGVVAIRGVAISSQVKEQLLHLKEKISGLKKINTFSVPLTNLISKLTIELGYQGLAHSIALVPDGEDKIIIQGSVDSDKIGLFHQLVALFSQNNRVTILERVQPMIRLPFEVRSVVGGSTPFIVTDTGKKLIAGAVVDGITFVGLDEKSGKAIFKKNGLTVTLPLNS